MIKITEVEKLGNKLRITIGADDPNELMESKTADKALKAALKRGFKEVNHIGNIRVFGQNSLATRRFTFTR